MKSKKILAFCLSAGSALWGWDVYAEEFDIRAQSLANALKEFSNVSGLSLFFSPHDLIQRKSPPVEGEYAPLKALHMLLYGSGLEIIQNKNGAIVIRKPRPKPVPRKEAVQNQAEEEKPNPENEKEEERFAIDEIIVTAQKRLQNLQKIPLSVSILSQKDLDVFNVSGGDIRIFAARIPSLNIESSFGGRSYPRLYIRGLGNPDFTMNATQPVSLYYDEVVLDNPMIKGLPAYDLKRVEVLRGPQGSLWGKNTPAGAVHFISKTPSGDQKSYARVTYGRYNSLNLEGAAGFNLIDGTLSTRLSAIFQSRDGWVENLTSGNKIDGYEDFAGRFQLLWTPVENFDALFKFHIRTMDGASALFHDIDQSDASKEHLAHDSDQVDFQEINQTGASLKLQYEIGSINLTSITGLETGNMLSIGDLDGSEIVKNVNSSSIDSLSQFTEEFRISNSDDAALDWQVGLFYFHEKLEYHNSFTDLQEERALFQKVHQNSESWALFGQLTYDLNDRLDLSLGGRYSREEKHLRQTSLLYQPDPKDIHDPDQALADFGPDVVGPGAGEWGQFTWDLGLSYQVNENSHYYARLAKGFRGGAINGGAIFGDPIVSVKPERVISIEGGLKTEFLDGGLRLNMGGYYYRFRDQQLTSQLSTNQISLTNTEGGQGYGLEIDADFIPTKNLQLSGGLSFNHTAFMGPSIIPHPQTGLPLDIEGNRFPNAPKWLADMLIHYKIPLANQNELFILTDWAYRGHQYFTPAGRAAEILSVSGYWMGGFRAGYRMHNGRTEIAAWVRNITDVNKLNCGFNVFGNRGCFTGPRVWGMDLKIEF